jgi:hypothetical protein
MWIFLERVYTKTNWWIKKGNKTGPYWKDLAISNLKKLKNCQAD